MVLMPGPDASILRVLLLGAVPGVYFDFARLTFQVPTSVLLDWASATGTTPISTPRSPAANNRLVDVRIPHLLQCCRVSAKSGQCRLLLVEDLHVVKSHALGVVT